ncbi:membrane-anchored junction protein [Pipistrellus kuhlii]|uniref:Membrane anchored junction protein n=1 Tax=Pipistrellus kuhlii TaxID=59472 RepID=A0A7J7R0Y6_PIPKU|nr:membrane-anchored junction protein [Pipistrellus kuhlii]KAF6269830.1 membrane anchored junction protein [Pipistrellus kuhlii]
MSLKPFTYPFPETRFLHSGTSVYKFKIRYGDSIRGEDVENKEVIIQELEDSIRVVLGNLDSLQPFATEHFVVFPYKSKWERVSHLKFKNGDIVLIPYPFVLTLYVELKWFNENLSSGRPVDDGSLGLVLAERKAARAMKKKRKRMELSISPSRPGPDRTGKETPSRDVRSLQHLMALMARHRVLGGRRAHQERLAHRCSKATHLHLRAPQARGPVASLGF